MAEFDTDNWPEHSEELGRKMLVQLTKWAAKHEEGKITMRELYLICDVLYETCVGLAPMEAVDLVVDAHTEIRNYVRLRKSAL